MIYGSTANLKLNLKMLLDVAFLKDGHFQNIQRNRTIYGVDASKLVLDVSASSDFGGISGCQVWQSPFQQWVYESGITLNQSPMISGLSEPTRCSGIYVNGTFMQNSVSGNIFYVDYQNGRVIFSGTGIPSDTNIQADYAYKFWRVDFSLKSVNKDIQIYSETYLKDNPFDGISSIIYPSGTDNRINVFPAIYLQFPDETFEPYELGNLTQIENHIVWAHIYALDDWDLTTARDILKSRIRNSYALIDFNYAPLPLSGIVKTLNPNYMSYQLMQTNPVYNGNNVSWGMYSFDDARYRDDDMIGNELPDAFFKGIFEYRIKLYNVSSTGRGPANPYIT